MAYARPKYRAMKYAGDDMYSWALFYSKDVKGLRSPVSELSNIRPLVSGCSKSEINHYKTQYENIDKNKS